MRRKQPHDLAARALDAADPRNERASLVLVRRRRFDQDHLPRTKSVTLSVGRRRKRRSTREESLDSLAEANRPKHASNRLYNDSHGLAAADA